MSYLTWTSSGTSGTWCLSTNASLLAFALFKNSFWASFTFSSLPYHFWIQVVYSPLPNEYDKYHGLGTSLTSLIALKFSVTSSSFCPPDKKNIPLTAGKTDLDSANTVLKATSSDFTFALSWWSFPGSTILVFKITPSKQTLLSFRDKFKALLTLSEIFWLCSMSCGPRVLMSISTIGTNPLAWEMAANLAKFQVLSWTA